MKYRKFNRYEKKENKRESVKNAMAGTGIYVYLNPSRQAEITLPRPTASGLRTIGPGQKFQGDDYYMQLVRAGELRFVECIQQFTPEDTETSVEEELAIEEKLMNEQKLILDQPNTVTTKGTVEHVVETRVKQQPLHENGDQRAPDVLLNESPGDDGFVIVTE